jgi:hypothetical protein
VANRPVVSRITATAGMMARHLANLNRLARLAAKLLPVRSFA